MDFFSNLLTVKPVFQNLINPIKIKMPHCIFSGMIQKMGPELYTIFCLSMRALETLGKK